MYNLHMYTRLGVWGHIPPGDFLEIRCPEIASEAILKQKHTLGVIGDILSGSLVPRLISSCACGRKEPGNIRRFKLLISGASNQTRQDACSLKAWGANVTWPKTSKEFWDCMLKARYIQASPQVRHAIYRSTVLPKLDYSTGKTALNSAITASRRLTLEFSSRQKPWLWPFFQ